MISNGYDVASRLNGKLDNEWAACVGCAIIRREQERLGIEQTEQCKSVLRIIAGMVQYTKVNLWATTSVMKA